MYFIVVKILKQVTTHNLMIPVNMLQQRNKEDPIATYYRVSDPYLRIKYVDHFQAGVRSRDVERLQKSTA